MSKSDRQPQQASLRGSDSERAPTPRGNRGSRDPAAEARATLADLSRPSALFDGWLLPRAPRNPDRAAERAPDEAERDGTPTPLGRILLGPAVLFAVLLVSLLLLLRAVG